MPPKSAKTSRPVGRPPAGARAGEKVKDYPQLSVRVPGDIKAKLQALSAVSSRPQWRVISDAIECYVRARSVLERHIVDEVVQRSRADPRESGSVTGDADENLPRTSPVILVADADDDTRALYREILRPAGWEVVEGLDGRDALAKAFVHRPTLVVTELNLPVMDGLALCEILRRDRTNARLSILVVTAESRAHKLSRALTLADAVLVKPTMPESVLEEIIRLTSRM
jgi:two-component system chemotaxis response regulator CheY